MQGQLLIGIVSVLLIGYVGALTLRGHLSEQWCLLWVTTLGVATVSVAAPTLLAWMTHLVGAVYPASALTMLALFFLLVLAIRASSEATVHSRQIAALTQQLALLRQRVDTLDRQAEEDGGSAGHGVR